MLVHVSVDLSMENQNQPNFQKRNSVEKSRRTSAEANNFPVNPQKNQPASTSHKEKCKKLISTIIEHWAFTAWMTALTVYALFGDDLRLLATNKSDDEIFYSLSTVCLFFFLLEIILSSIVKEGYFFSFFFWLDIVATISLIPDIGWIWDEFMSAVSDEDSSDDADAADASQIARAGRASRAGTRAGRIIRILRVIRLIRIVKLYKLSQEARASNSQNKGRVFKKKQVVFRGEQVPFEANRNIQENFDGVSVSDGSLSESFSVNQEVNYDTGMAVTTENEARLTPEIEGEQEDEKRLDFSVPEESKVGKKLSELTTRRVIMLVLGMMFGLPLFYTTLYLDTNTSYQFGLEILDKFINDEENFEIAWDSYIDEHEDLDTPLIFLEVENTDYKFETDTDPDDLRSTEKELVTIQDLDEDYDYASLAIFDLRYDTRLEAGLNMIRTVFVCVVLAISSILFSNDAQNLILGPIENMIIKVKNIAQNPLKAAQEEEREEYTRQLVMKENKDFKEETKKDSMETAFLEKTLTKIGALLALGFGEAGSEIIASNMQKGGGDVDPMIPGKRSHCIFGFCDIRNFTDTTEILQQDVMLFVNEIAQVVHSIVDEYSGNANKNIGDAFLLVWKFPEETLEKTPDGLQLKEDPFVKALADMSIISFIKIIAAISTNPKIVKYQDHPLLVEHMPGYQVKMGFGLHQGWAIEGAIGSEYKIDASYLSPNVNMASRLEAATKQFGVPLLISDDLYNICSNEMQVQLRCIDKVTVKGSIKPIALYTCDLDTSPLLVKESFGEGEKGDLKMARVIARIERDHLREQAKEGSIVLSDLFEDDEELKIMKQGISDLFLKEFAKGLKSYFEGNWEVALDCFRLAEQLRNGWDGPSRTLIEFIEEEGGVAPPNWPGYRELHEK